MSAQHKEALAVGRDEGRAVRRYLEALEAHKPRRGRKRMRTPTTLAFVDSRTDDEVVIATDNSYGDTFQIAAYLKQYAAKAQEIV